MKAIMVMFDSLNRHMLTPYGCDWVHNPNFGRLARESVTFTNNYAGSLPCIPARRELHTGRYNFLHRSWGPLEPFDDSMPQILKENGTYTHLVSDHYHYWEDGGCTYHSRYSSWEISRGQEGDPWKGELTDPEIPESIGYTGNVSRQDWINRKYAGNLKTHPQVKTFDKGIDFIRTNHNEDNWFLQIETFDPHEPFFSNPKYENLYPHEYKGPHFDWPVYGKTGEPSDQVKHCRYKYASLLSMCDDSLGRVLKTMDDYDMWKDTMLIVNTDHGYLLGEHGWWGKCIQPFYNEVAHTPLFIWDPRSAIRGKRCDCLVQTIDLAPTLLEFFGAGIPRDMQGKALKDTIALDRPVRQAALFGMHGAHVNCTDGRYVYMRAPANTSNEPLYEYTLMPAHMKKMFDVSELRDIELSGPFSFTKGCRTMKIPAAGSLGKHVDSYGYGSLLFDLKADPSQDQTVSDSEIENIMTGHIIRLMKENDAPPEQFERLGL